MEVEKLVGDLGRVAEVIASAPFPDQREIVRGKTHEITIDGETMRGEIAFYAVPRLEVASINEDGPAEGADVLSLVMAGGFGGGEKADFSELRCVSPTLRRTCSRPFLRSTPFR